SGGLLYRPDQLCEDSPHAPECTRLCDPDRAPRRVERRIRLPQRREHRRGPEHQVREVLGQDRRERERDDRGAGLPGEAPGGFGAPAAGRAAAAPATAAAAAAAGGAGDGPGGHALRLPAAHGPAAAGPGAEDHQHYWMVTHQNAPGMTEFDIDVYVNAKWLMTLRNTSQQDVVEVTRFLQPGQNS